MIIDFVFLLLFLQTLCNACGIRHRKKTRTLVGLDDEREERNRRKIGKSSTSNNKVKLGLKKKLGEVEQAAVLLMALSYGCISAYKQKERFLLENSWIDNLILYNADFYCFKVSHLLFWVLWACMRLLVLAYILLANMVKFMFFWIGNERLIQEKRLTKFRYNHFSRSQ